MSTNSNKNSVESIDSPNTPNLIGIKRIDSMKRHNSSSKNNNSNLSLNECELTGSRSNLDQPINSPNIVKMVSSKPPLDKRTYKLQTQKPLMQGWLHRKTQDPSSKSSSSLSLTNSSNMTSSITSTCSSNTSSGSISTNKPQSGLLKNPLSSRSKWKKYWCVLMKDFIIFYKNPDEKTPKDFLMLKDFEITKELTNKKLGFCLVEKAKQSVYEFYAEQSDEYNEWYQALSDAHTRLIGEPLTSLSSTSLSSSSGYETIGGLSLLSNLNNRDDLSIGSSSSTNSSFQSQPSSSTFNRKNNLQLQLSTIIDANDDALNASFKNADKKAASPTLSTNASPTLINNLQYNNSSSRESSPDLSNCNSKLGSRDSSPGLTYRK